MVLLKTCFLEPQGDERDEDVFKAVLRTWLHGKRLFFFKDAVFLSVTDFRAWESLDVFFRALESFHGKNEKFFKQNGSQTRLPDGRGRRTWSRAHGAGPRRRGRPGRFLNRRHDVQLVNSQRKELQRKVQQNTHNSLSYLIHDSRYHD